MSEFQRKVGQSRFLPKQNFLFGTKQCYNIVFPGPTAGTQFNIQICGRFDCFLCCPQSKKCVSFDFSVDGGLNITGSRGVQKGSSPPLKNWRNPINIKRIFNKMPGKAFNVPFRHGIGSCPEEGLQGKVCGTASVGIALWTFGARVCYGSDGWTWRLGMGIGQGTGIAIGGDITLTQCWRN